jgi:hypothetical protein
MKSLTKFWEYLDEIVNEEIKAIRDMEAAIRKNDLAYWLRWHGVYLIEVSTRSFLAQKYISRIEAIEADAPNSDNFLGDWEKLKALIIDIFEDDMPRLRVSSKNSSPAANIAEEATIAFYLDAIRTLKKGR